MRRIAGWLGMDIVSAWKELKKTVAEGSLKMGSWSAPEGERVSPMNEKEIEIIESNLLDLAIEGDGAAAQQYASLYLFRRNWERTRSVQSWQHLADRARNAQAWLSAIQ